LIKGWRDPQARELSNWLLMSAGAKPTRRGLSFATRLNSLFQHMFLRLVHVTRCDYSEPVSFAPHALYLRPRETPRQRLHHHTLEITPTARRIATHDPLDNALDWAFFAPENPATKLEFRSELLVETLDSNPFDFYLKPSALTFPFTYDATEQAALASYLTPRVDSPAPEFLRDWLGQRLSSAPTETVPYLMALTTAVQRALVYTRRDEQGVQSSAQTLARGTGSCRDYAVLLMELCRALGLAARFVSGYLYEPAASGARPAFPPSMHAWAEVYLPGAGWRGLDPTRGIFCDDAFVRVAHAPVAEHVNPIQGTSYGSPSATAKLTTVLSVEKLEPHDGVAA
jgi:transglutaminase-like putative cysteine protease